MVKPYSNLNSFGCLKVLFILLNALITINGCVAVAVGALKLTDPTADVLQEMDIGVSDIKTTSYVIIAAGVILIVLGIVGCIATFKVPQVLFPIYFVIMAVSACLLLTVAGLSWSGSSGDKLQKTVQDYIDAVIEETSAITETAQDNLNLLKDKEKKWKKLGLSVLESVIETTLNSRMKRSIFSNSSRNKFSGLTNKLKGVFKQKQSLKKTPSTILTTAGKTKFQTKLKNFGSKAALKAKVLGASSMSLLGTTVLSALPMILSAAYEANPVTTTEQQSFQIQQSTLELIEDNNNLATLQMELQCCGSTNRESYEKFRAQPPKSCPAITTAKGCGEAVKTYVSNTTNTLGITSVIILLMEVVAVCVAIFILCSGKPQAYKQVTKPEESNEKLVKHNIHFNLEPLYSNTV